MDFIQEFYKIFDLNLLNRVTLIIPTHNRNFYLSRCLWYHSHFPYNEIIIADSSNDEKRKINQLTVCKLGKNNIRYIPYLFNSDPYGKDVYTKWADALNYVQSDYSVFSTDKEFTLPLTTCKCVDFLDEHLDYNTIDGQYISADYDSSCKINFIKEYPTKCSISFSNPLSRLLIGQLYKNASSSLLALRRSKFHKNLYSSINSYSLNDIRFGEFTVEFLSLILSKHMYLCDDPFRCRDQSRLKEHGKVKFEESSNVRYPLLDKYIECGIYESTFERFANCLAEAINLEMSSISKEEAINLISLSFPRILDDRGFYGTYSYPGILKPNTLLFKTWQEFQNIVSRIFKYEQKELASRLYINHPTEELEIIRRVIEENKAFYEIDTPII